MAVKRITATLVIAAGLLTVPAAAQNGPVVLLHKHASDSAVSVTRNEGGSGVTVVRGPSSFVAASPAAAAPVAYIDGEKIKTDSLEPASNWFVDRSGGRLVLVHCFARQPVLVGGDRCIFCDARRF